MARVNKSTDGSFSKLFAGAGTPTFEFFIENNNPENPSSNLKKYIKMYKDFISKEKLKLKRISLVEEIIMQMRSRENITDIRISLVNNYIYARVAFHRRDKRVRDVSVIADNREFWKKYSVKKLFSDENFMSKAKEKLSAQMDVLINKNIERLADIDERIAKLELPVVQNAQPKAPAAKTKAPAKAKAKKADVILEGVEVATKAL